jgi:N,N-dimethylformamidase
VADDRRGAAAAVTKWLVGYSDRISVRPSETVSFMTSAVGIEHYTVDIVRVICGEDDPAGPGCNMPVVASNIAGRVPARSQPIHRGSHGRVSGIQLPQKLAEAFTLGVFVYPTSPGRGRQSLIAIVDHGGTDCINLYLDSSGALVASWRDANGSASSISTDTPLLAHGWYLASLTWDAREQRMTLVQTRRAAVNAPRAAHASVLTHSAPHFPTAADVLFATAAGPANREHFNGKLDTPALFGEGIHAQELQQLFEDPAVSSKHGAIVSMWDFSLHIPTDRVVDIAGNAPDGRLFNLPTRAVTGWLWNGEEHHWRKRPGHYRAIHFHDDDLYDAGWEVDFKFKVPESWPSGVYAAHLSSEGIEEHLPFVVRPATRNRRPSVAFLFPDASYMAYANFLEHTKYPDWFEPFLGRLIELSSTECALLEHPELDGCLYSMHSDGSGVHYSSRLRPILNMRPKYRSAVGGDGCGAWQFKADTHILAWLHRIGVEHDVLCDEDLDREGLEALDGYQVLITGTHPEYVSARMRAAHEGFLARGGRLMYLGGNGFYLKVAYDELHPGMVELRRGESGSRAWASRTGEYHHAFGPSSSALGGMWRTSGAAPNTLLGVGFTAQGFDSCAAYERKPGSYDARARFIFAGIGNQVFGDFGLSGGGAAGLEIDRAEIALGTPAHALVLASSTGQSPNYLIAAEEILEMHPFTSGDVSDQVRADLVFYECSGGGAVFSTGSIAWSAALSHNSYDNDVARITENTLRRFMSAEPFKLP